MRTERTKTIYNIKREQNTRDVAAERINKRRGGGAGGSEGEGGAA